MDRGSPQLDAERQKGQIKKKKKKTNIVQYVTIKLRFKSVGVLLRDWIRVEGSGTQ